jgi:hypothetical protein
MFPKFLVHGSPRVPVTFFVVVFVASLTASVQLIRWLSPKNLIGEFASWPVEIAVFSLENCKSPTILPGVLCGAPGCLSAQFGKCSCRTLSLEGACQLRSPMSGLLFGSLLELSL